MYLLILLLALLLVLVRFCLICLFILLFFVKSNFFIASISVVHPLDVIRTRIQTDGNRKGAFHIAKDIVNNYGFKGLYTGFTPPLAAQALYKAVIFASIGFSKRAIITSSKNENHKLSLFENSICGIFAGTVNSLVVCPIELVRNRLIAATQLKSNIYSGPIDCIKKVIKNDGILGFYRGWAATVLRDGPGLGAWFAAFETARKLIPSITGLKENDSLTLLLSGSCGGIAFWTVALPMDAIKSIIQTSYGNQNNMGLLTKKVKTNGIIWLIQDLYRGYPIALARGIPASAIVFLVNQRVVGFLQTISKKE